MTLQPAVLISLRDEVPFGGDLERRLVDWVRELGYEPQVANGGPEAVAWVRRRPYAASFCDCETEAATGVEAWRSIHAVLGRRLVLMVREPRRDLWFEALREGVGALLPLPPREPMVRAALSAAIGDSWSRSPRAGRPA